MKPKVAILDKYGLLKVIKEIDSYIDIGKNGVKRLRRRVECICDCGNEITINLGLLITGNTKSCGCLKKKLTGDRKRTHGLSKSPEYSIWCKMKDRCYVPSTKGYHCYGGKGIKVCKRWLHSFENFLEDMGKRPSNKYSIERVWSNRDYKPSNCKWATQKEQTRNISTNTIVKYKGKNTKLILLCDKYNIIPSMVRARLKSGWDIDSALTEPKGTRYKKLNKI